jgi:tetratricopeptide (TPR) repeat protein
VQSLRAYVRESDSELLRTQLGRGAADLAHLLPELREHVPEAPEQPALDPEGARFRLFDAVSSFLFAAAAARPLVLMLDDLHAADEPSLVLLQFVARELASSRLLVVGAYRDVDPVLREPLASAVAVLVREPVAGRIALSGLAEHDVADYIELATGERPDEDLVGAIHVKTEGNPLFVGEIVRLLAAEGGLAEPADARLGIPRGIREVLDSRVGRLSPECRLVLVLASVLGLEFGLTELARSAGLADDELTDLLDEAAAEGLVADVPGGPGRMRFSHVLLRDVLYEGLRGPRRTQLHRQVAGALEALYTARPEPHLAELAHHFVEAAPGGDVGRAIEYATRAADRALAQLAYEEAARLYATALDTAELAQAADDVTRGELLLALSDAQARAGDMPFARETALLAADLARRTGNAEQLARAALGYGGRPVVHAAAQDLRFVPLLEEALAAVGSADSELRAKLLARLAGALRDRPDREIRAALGAEGLEIARRLGEPTTLAYALDGSVAANWWPGNAQERLQLGGELIELAQRIGDRERAFFGHGYRMYALMEIGEMEAAYSELETRARIAEEQRQPSQLWFVAANRGLRALFQGRFDEAEDRIPEALMIGERVERRESSLAARHQLFVLRREQGRLGELEPMLSGSEGRSPARWLLALLYSELGREAEARSVFDALAAGGFVDVPYELEWLLAMCFLSEVCAFLSDAERAAVLFETLLPYAALNVVSAPELSVGAASRYLGILASTMERWDEAERHFEHALAMNERMGAPPWLAHAQHDYARMLVARDGPGDRKRSEELLDRAIANYRELGMTAALAR